MGQYAIPIGRAGGLLCGGHPRKKHGWDLLIGVQPKIFFIHWEPTRKKTDLINLVQKKNLSDNFQPEKKPTSLAPSHYCGGGVI